MAASKPKTVADFMADNDRETAVKNKIEAAFRAMLKIGPQEHDTETEMAKRAGLQLAELIKSRDQFHRHIAFCPKLMGRKERYVWFADPKQVPAKFRYNPETTSG